ncbi:MAG: putative transrane lipoprotein [Betaproteobacteria bacterium]|nr:putative transrane lipoprotein [Betaproteobacteria bacterium]
MTPAEKVRRTLYLLAAASLVVLIVLGVAWELWLAPLRPGGSWLALKVVPLLAALPGVLRARLYTFRWAMMLVLAYFTEGIVRAYAEHGTSATLATIEIVLSLVFYAAAICYVRVARAPAR